MKDLNGKVVAITGAGGGIGRALALEFAGRGCALALADVDADGLEATRAAVTETGVGVTTHRVDVSDREAVEAWAAEVVERHGRVNVVVNNAGVALSGTVAGLSYDDYRWIVDINFWGVVHGTKAFLPHLEASGEGHVVNVSSTFGLAAQPLMSGYNASKFAVRGFTESLRQDLDLASSPVSATCVHPGGIRTGITARTRVNTSVATLTGRDESDSTRQYERLLITSPETVAAKVVRGVERNSRRVLIGPDALAIDALVRLAPTGYQRVMSGLVRAQRPRKGRAAR